MLSPVRFLAPTLALLFSVGAVPALVAQASTKVIVPTEKITLFNGKDLTNFYTWLRGHKYADPDRVFTVVDHIDGGPAIRASGQHFGGIVTRERYAN